MTLKQTLTFPEESFLTLEMVIVVVLFPLVFLSSAMPVVITVEDPSLNHVIDEIAWKQLVG